MKSVLRSDLSLNAWPDLRSKHFAMALLWLLVAISGFSLPRSAAAQTPTGTFTLDLGGAWKWRAESNRKSGDQGDTTTGWHQPAYDDSGWETLEVGKNWEAQGKSFNGVAWYRRSFALDAAPRDAPLLLNLGSPDDGCEIYLNGESIGIWKFQQNIQAVLPANLLRWNAPNVIAVRVWDWYQMGGITGADFSIRARTVAAAPPLALKVTEALPVDTLQSPRWEYGWRDEGTSDTRPKLQTLSKVFNGKDAIEMDVWYPNSTEFLDYVLGADESGATWVNAQPEFISFWYRTMSLRGDISIRLSEGQNLWTQAAPVWQSLVRVKPGDWTRVVLPLNGFTRPDPETTQDPANRLGSIANITHLSIGFGNHHLQAPGKIQFADFQVTGAAQPGLIYRPDDLAGTMPQNAAAVLLARADAPSQLLAPESFEMGAKPAQSLDLVFRFALGAVAPARFRLQFEIEDCFDRTIAAGTVPLSLQPQSWQARIRLSTAQTRMLYYGEWFRARVAILNEQDQYVFVRSFPDGLQRHFKLKYAQRDALSLAALSPISENTSQGMLKLVDIIDAAANPEQDLHPYKEGGIRNSWVGRRANTPWINGIAVYSLDGRSYREAKNNQFFAYRIGRGKLSPHKAYLLRVLVPDDKSRYVAMDIKAGRNSQGTGYKTRSAVEPVDPAQPFSKKFVWYDHIVINDDVTYGYSGSRSTSAENGFWVVFHDIGRAYAAAYDGGPAVAEMRLYELPDNFSTAPKIAPNSSRLLMMDWERQPESPPEDVVRYAKLMGLNALAPSIQKWSFNGFWYSSLGFKPSGFYKTAPAGEDDRGIYQDWLDATRNSGIKLVPRIEYGGGPNLPQAAWVIGPDGNIDPVGRYADWGANLLHPATLKEIKTLIDEIVGQQIAANPQLAGLLWRQRQDRLKCSYGPRDIQLFATETGTVVPSGSAQALARWASGNPEYAKWWQLKRAEFLRAVRDHLRKYRSDLVLYYYNWDEDGFDPPPAGSAMSATDWSELHNVSLARNHEKRVAKLRQATAPEYYVNYVTMQATPHMNIQPHAFGGDSGIRILAPISQRHLSDNPGFLDLFWTQDGIAAANVVSYEERGRWNMQWDDYETSELTPGFGKSSLLNERNALKNTDTDVITTTSYTYGRGWVGEFQQFAVDFLNAVDAGAR
jgi:hypothetical protein